ncbi:HK97-gp10 family putative phage morphogenesis protein [Novosphingobium sp. 9U]|uniref:HK97-gp10 family putative phage morphogenesis protein n=1 Tax=Novosphingobium sp. 9U TaxID=2653158 RepID=UPI0012F181BA|nr:HK97-gp10 family putative phage morphogenesis protein [Novosphingobium sp. 9U]VWX51760.1 conserved hypothetical protein [Novosphingobium sp. 9U]
MASSLKGFAELERRLAAMGDPKKATKIGQSAVRAGMVVIQKATKAAAPFGPDATGSPRTRRRKGGAQVQETHTKIVDGLKVRKIKVQGDYKVSSALTAGAAYHAAFAESGSIHNAPTHFASKAFNANIDAAEAAMAKVFERRLAKEGV